MHVVLVEGVDTVLVTFDNEFPSFASKFVRKKSTPVSLREQYCGVRRQHAWMPAERELERRWEGQTMRRDSLDQHVNNVQDLLQDLTVKLDGGTPIRSAVK